MIEAMSVSSRSPVAAAVLGLVLLSGLVAFATLPKDDAEPAEPAGSATEETAVEPSENLELPDRLGDDLVAIDTGDLPGAIKAKLGDLDAMADQEASVDERLRSVYDSPADFRYYMPEDGSALLAVTALDRAPGLFLPDLPPVEPGLVGLARTSSELVEVDDAVCAVGWGQSVPQGQAADPDAVPQTLRCQRGAGERTYEVSSQGYTVDQAAAVLAALAA